VNTTNRVAHHPILDAIAKRKNTGKHSKFTRLVKLENAITSYRFKFSRNAYYGSFAKRSARPKASQKAVVDFQARGGSRKALPESLFLSELGDLEACLLKI
jgi:hypothetical protein